MKNFDLSFQYPLRLLLFIPALAVILIPLFRIPRKRRTLKKNLPALLRSIVSLLLVLAISGLQYSFSSSKQAVILVIDQSDSIISHNDAVLEKAQEIVDKIDSSSLLGVIKFAEKQVTLLDVNSDRSSFDTSELVIPENRVYSGDLPVGASVTNLEQALEYAASLFPAGRAKRIIVLSDGRETDGHADAAAQALSNRGIRVDAIHFDTVLEGNDIQVDSVKCPSGANVGDEIPIVATITSTCDSYAVIRLNRSAYEIQNKAVILREGENTVEFTLPIEESGKHTFNITVSANENNNSINRNDVGYCCVNATSSISLLAITNKESDADPLKSALSEEYTLTAVTARNAPRIMVELCNYDAMILLNIDMEDLPEGYDSIMRDYVELQGRSLLVCGGGDTFMYGNMVGTEIEKILPVDFTVVEESKGDSIAVMILLDTSLSMAGNYIVMAKEGATKCIEALSDKDYCGLVTFNQFAVMNAPLSRATAVYKQQVMENISTATTMNQTIFARPLMMAYSELANCDAAVRMAVLLSDGGPGDTAYSAVAKKMASEGITVSTIGMGFPSTILAALAQDGCGHFSYATTADDLPEIILGEAEQQALSAVHLGVTDLRIAQDNVLTEGLTEADLPPVTGYMPTVMKQEHTAWITTADGMPIYAVNDCGKGKAAVFASDLTDRWCLDWYSSETAKTVINRMISTTLSPENHGSAMNAAITHRGKNISVVLSTAGSEVPVTAEMQVSNIHGSSTVAMNAAQRNTFKCSFITNREGAYDVTFALKDPDGNVVDYLNSFFSVDYSDEYDSFSPDGRSVLDTVTSMTGGTVTDSTDQVASFQAEDTTVYREPLGLLASLCLVLILADIAIRKLRWADIKGLFRKN